MFLGFVNLWNYVVACLGLYYLALWASNFGYCGLNRRNAQIRELIVALTGIIDTPKG
ncbi:hypothetical protein RchiOBHm_Chr5g0001241 [Rosa chinensis]|uniref:Uncharacterized protein n=1 Tax=Rosa chinensis TaxID=74649 RepID=A0A2P6Q2B2_ROSCH|nr:hypothetical protein RchiOBHm_Chr5g0001241 [Rosa chinensis]